MKKKQRIKALRSEIAQDEKTVICWMEHAHYSNQQLIQAQATVDRYKARLQRERAELAALLAEKGGAH